MNASTQQIINLSKQGFEPEQIATALGLRVEDVHMTVTQDSGVRKSLKAGELDDQFKSLAQSAIKTLEYLMQGAENENVRKQAAVYILDQVQGRFKPRERTTIQNNYQFIVQRASAAKAKAAEDAMKVVEV